MKRIVVPAVVAVSLFAGVQVVATVAADALPAGCSTAHSGATGTMKCTGSPVNGYTQYQVSLTCYDGISGTFVAGGPGAWVSWGHTATATCGAPQRQTVSAMTGNFR